MYSFNLQLSSSAVAKNVSRSRCSFGQVFVDVSVSPRLPKASPRFQHLQKDCFCNREDRFLNRSSPAHLRAASDQQARCAGPWPGQSRPSLPLLDRKSSLESSLTFRTRNLQESFTNNCPHRRIGVFPRHHPTTNFCNRALPDHPYPGCTRIHRTFKSTVPAGFCIPRIAG